MDSPPLVPRPFHLIPIDKNVYRAPGPHVVAKGRSRVYGGQTAAQVLLAIRSYLPHLCPASLNVNFLSPAAQDRPLDYAIEETGDERVWRVRILQGKKVVALGHFSALLDGESQTEGSSFTDVISPPEYYPDIEEVGRALPLPGSLHDFKHLVFADLSIFHTRVIETARFTERHRNVYFAKLTISHDDLPKGDEVAVAVLLSDFDILLLAITLHIEHGILPPNSASLNHSIWFHQNKVRASDWFIFEIHIPVISKQRVIMDSAVFNKRGRRVLTIRQEGVTIPVSNSSKL